LLDGKNSPVDDADLPAGYKFYEWRKMMGAGAMTSDQVSLRTMMDDMEFYSIESTLRKSKEKNK
jgi:hypothetical protein